MLAHNLKDILSLVPEAIEMVKQANLEADFPLDCKDSAAASYLQAHYLIKVAGKPVCPDKLALIEKAASLYGIKEELDIMLPRLNNFEKQASFNQERYGLSLKELESNFEGDLCGFLGIEKAASEANRLIEQYGDQVKSKEVLRYAGQGWLNKEAALKSLANRVYAIKEKNIDDAQAFTKVARIMLDSVKENDYNSIKQLCGTITSLDKKAGLDLIGFNFYKEALITKEAGLSQLNVSLAGEQIPYEKIQRFGKDRIGSTLGADIAKEMNGDPVSEKAMLESLPRDLQVMLKSLVKGN